MNKLPRNATGLLVVLASLLAWTHAGHAQTQTFSKWTSITPDPRQFATQRGGVLPLVVLGGDTPYFEAGQYMIYVAASNPNGMKVSRWNRFGPFTLQGHDKWKVTLLPGSQLRMENNPAPLQAYASPGPTYAMIYVANEDVTSWHSICVLPVGAGKNVQPDCFGGTSNIVYDPSGAESAPPAPVPTYSKWTSITPDPRQFATQPGGALPLIVLDGDTPHFDAGQYMIYVAPSNPDGMKVSRWTRFGPFTLQGNDKWKATLLPQSQLRMERNPAPLQPYASPGPSHAMIYVRNDDLASWHSICVLPVGTGKNVQPDCFGGSGNVVYEPSGPESIPPTAGAGFSVAAGLDNWEESRAKEDSIVLKRKTAKIKAPCGWDASVDASITAKFTGAARKPKDAAEALALAEVSFKARRQGATPSDMAVGLALVGGKEGASSFAMGDFTGAIADFALWLRRGSWGAGYTGESFGSNGAGQVVRNGEVIEFGYGVNGRGCWDNSSRSYLVTQGVAAQEEARAILASLRWDGKKSTIKTPYLGPKYDGSDLPKVALSPATLAKLRVGDTVTIKATVQNAKPEDRPLTFNWSGTFDGTPAAAKSSPVVRLKPTKPGKYRVDVGVDGARFGLGGAGLEYEVVAGPATPTTSTKSAQERDVIRISNSGGVNSGPTAPAVVTLNEAYVITLVSTYHWNAGRGTPRSGTIALRHSSGRVYGPWNTTGGPGQGGVPNANWEARPNVELPPGAYTVIDSDPATWAQNAESGGRGFVIVRGHRRQ